MAARLITVSQILLRFYMFSSFVITCPNHLKTLWSTLLANPLSIPVLLTRFIHDSLIWFLKHLNFPFSQHLSYPNPPLRVTQLMSFLLHIDTSWHLSPVVDWSAHFFHTHALYPSFIRCTTSLSHYQFAVTCHPMYLKQFPSYIDLSLI